MRHILLAEDDPAIVRALSEFLSGEDYTVTAASGEGEARARLTEGGFDLALIDLALAGGGDGFAVCRTARAMGVPAIFLTASADENCVVDGLELGADDYVVKPFRPRELLSRIRGALRRRYGDGGIALPGAVTVDLDRREVRKGGQTVALTALEYRLLEALVARRGKLTTRERLLEELWDVDGDFVNDNTLTVYIKRLREKLGDDPREPALIKTVRGQGYRID